MADSKTNPYELLNYRRKIKRFEETGITDSMKLIKTVREMKLDNNILKATEFPRVLLWVVKKIGNSEDENKVKLSKMCKYLFKEWREQI